MNSFDIRRSIGEAYARGWQQLGRGRGVWGTGAVLLVSAVSRMPCAVEPGGSDVREGGGGRRVRRTGAFVPGAQGEGC